MYPERMNRCHERGCGRWQNVGKGLGQKESKNATRMPHLVYEFKLINYCGFYRYLRTLSQLFKLRKICGIEMVAITSNTKATGGL